jgi:hypothetical protein
MHNVQNCDSYIHERDLIYIYIYIYIYLFQIQTLS